MSIASNFKRLLKGPVGNNRDNDPEDILRTKEALTRLGYMAGEEEPHGYITREMNSALKTFQRDKDLKVDGWMQPGGETEDSLLQSLGYLVSNKKKAERDRFSAGGFASPARNVDATGRMTRDLASPDEDDDDEGGEEKDNAPPLPPRKPEPPEEETPEDPPEEEASECEELRAEMRELQSQKGALESEISARQSEITALEQETAAAYREFLEIASQYESSRIPTPNNIANYGLDLIVGAVTEHTTPDALDEEKAWTRYEEIKQANDAQIEILDKEIRNLGNQVRALQIEIEAVTAMYRQSGCGKRS